MTEKKIYSTVEEAIEDIKNGKMIIVADDESRENEGDLICAAEKITPELINFMVREAGGLICLSITKELANKLNLHPQSAVNTDVKGTAFTVSIDADPVHGVTTGISAFDRAKTIQVAVNQQANPSDLRRPGHVFPIEAKKGGVLERVGHTEASVDLAKLAGLHPSGVMCEIMNPDGTMARRKELAEFSKKHNIKFITVAQIISYRLCHERHVTREISTKLPTIYGDFEIYGYKNQLDGSEHVAIVKGSGEEFQNGIPVVRIHSECLTGDIFHSLKCDCGNQLASALELIEKEGLGALVYLRKHEGRGIGLLNKLKAYKLQEEGQDTVQANISLGFAPDLRDYGTGAQILLDLGIKNFKIITNNPKKMIGLEGYGLHIVDRVAIPPCINKFNEKYMHTKRDKMEHIL
ncbi:MAG: bifunctional 3,4-dihydroxy-2-butanone-4-phosphate synthase/GTP cyclohydrolase II [Candidatus Gastranaerophilales bacterium]|nr:bifunctional 3,4-dihydroxy-2-butanone-4-phosphate synthase/GTP cyclohydrolase II [Candidatus Gastranaerophilales bacterium]